MHAANYTTSPQTFIISRIHPAQECITSRRWTPTRKVQRWEKCAPSGRTSPAVEWSALGTDRVVSSRGKVVAFSVPAMLDILPSHKWRGFPKTNQNSSRLSRRAYRCRRYNILDLVLIVCWV